VSLSRIPCVCVTRQDTDCETVFIPLSLLPLLYRPCPALHIFRSAHALPFLSPSPTRCFSSLLGWSLHSPAWWIAWKFIQNTVLPPSACDAFPWSHAILFNLLLIIQFLFIMLANGERRILYKCYGLDDRGLFTGRRTKFFLSATASIPALRPTQPPAHWVPASCFLGIRSPGHETEHPRPCNAEVKNTWSYTTIPHTASWRDV
jgi:hypothetical protein